MVVASRNRRHGRQSVTAVERPRKSRSEKINLILIVRRNFLARVIVRAPSNLTVRIDELPVFTAVVRAPQLPALRGLAVHRYAVAGFNQGVSAIRILRRHAHRDSAYWRMRQAVSFQSLPRNPTIGRLEQSAAGSTALSPVSVNLHLPHPCKQYPRIVG